MNQSKQNNLAIQVLQMVKSLAPVKTGNLKFNSIRLHSRGISANEKGELINRFEITIGGHIAPYAVYTNEPWISDKWHGKKNPNEGWIDNAVELCARFTANGLSARLEKNDK